MGSDLATLRKLLEDQLLKSPTNTSSDTTSTLLNNYINKSIRRIVRRDLPRELISETTTNADITVGTNTVTIPTTILVPYLVYYTSQGGSIKELRYRNTKELVELNGPTDFFDSSRTGDPDFYTMQGSSLLFDRHFDRTETGAVKVYGVNVPTTLVNDTDTTELPIDYDLLITYESAILFYIRTDDAQDIQQFQLLADRERYQLKMELDGNTEEQITMDPYTFIGKKTNFRNPSIFFSS